MLNDFQLEYFSRHLKLKGLGLTGQEKLLTTHITCDLVDNFWKMMFFALKRCGVLCTHKIYDKSPNDMYEKVYVTQLLHQNIEQTIKENFDRYIFVSDSTIDFSCSPKSFNEKDLVVIDQSEFFQNIKELPEIYSYYLAVHLASEIILWVLEKRPKNFRLILSLQTTSE